MQDSYSSYNVKISLTIQHPYANTATLYHSAFVVKCLHAFNCYTIFQKGAIFWNFLANKGFGRSENISSELLRLISKILDLIMKPDFQGITLIVISR